MIQYVIKHDIKKILFIYKNTKYTITDYEIKESNNALLGFTMSLTLSPLNGDDVIDEVFHKIADAILEFTIKLGERNKLVIDLSQGKQIYHTTSFYHNVKTDEIVITL